MNGDGKVLKSYRNAVNSDGEALKGDEKALNDDGKALMSNESLNGADEVLKFDRVR